MARVEPHRFVATDASGGEVEVELLASGQLRVAASSPIGPAVADKNGHPVRQVLHAQVDLREQDSLQLRRWLDQKVADSRGDR